MEATKSRLSDEYYTPKWVTEPLGQIDLDPCAGPESTIASVNYRLTLGDDGLALPWFGLVWCNPPFSGKEKWMKKSIWHNNGFLLLPDRTSAPWWGPLAKKASAVFFMGKRIEFIGSPTSNNVGSTIFCFGELAANRIANSNLTGTLMNTISYTPRTQK